MIQPDSSSHATWYLLSNNLHNPFTLVVARKPRRIVAKLIHPDSSFLPFHNYNDPITETQHLMLSRIPSKGYDSVMTDVRYTSICQGPEGANLLSNATRKKKKRGVFHGYGTI
ncbi:hypothetical protein D5086_012454 [Populus alba]|uniref:Uncharacterized protein n=1 Tax=Populus alba TaxID=43335 RepID=A0ACC4C413_POPAL